MNTQNETVTITRRHRSFGYGATCQPEQTKGGLAIREPAIQSEGLTVREVADLYRADKRRFGGCDSRCLVTYKGSRVLSTIDDLLRFAEDRHRDEPKTLDLVVSK